ncbi:unnamed protein product, partial [Mesorhabditis belari]|uniref:Major facilitator superfamily (MFS) profile domain-containing protein n=1 Tax=Mesorhabditis belari TaxID=2138241 RepID=A0AAF3F795_9BILA
MISTKVLALFLVLLVAVCVYAEEESEHGLEATGHEKTLIRNRRWWPWGMGMGGMGYGMGMYPGMMMGGWGMRPFGIPPPSKGAKKTSWRSIYMATLMMALAGINMSIFFMANVSFGWWAQKTMKTAHPLIFGFSMAAIGNLIYSILPILPEQAALPLMLFGRILTGFCTGCLGVLRSFVAMCSAVEDRMKAMSTLSTGLTIGLSIGPVIQMCFMPIGSEGIRVFGLIQLNQYTTPGFIMFIVGIICVILLVTIFEENYVGIISDDEKTSNPWLVIPKFDRAPVLVMFYLWGLLMTIATSIYCVATPMSMAMFGWSSEEAVIYNAVLQTGSCICSAVTAFLLGRTRLGNMDRRKQLISGFLMFLLIMILFYPWFFYPGPQNETDMIAACNFDWCATRNRIPFWVYCFSFVILLGMGFPLCMTALNTRLSEILGPRKQSFVQGMMAFTGSLAQFWCPILVAFLYEKDGFRPVAVLNFGLHSVGIVLIIWVFGRMIPLEMEPPIGTPTKYKRGTFYRM